MLTFHILNGDCLAEQLKATPFHHNHIICRECLIDGDVSANTLPEFWEKRATFISRTAQISTEEYEAKSRTEFRKIELIPDGSEVYLWFENDLFCQVNLWFVISLLSKNTTLQVFRIFPKTNSENEKWIGFGNATSNDLVEAFHAKVRFSASDIALGNKLWKAYQQADFNALTQLSSIHSPCFEYLSEVCQAHIDRFPKDGSLGQPEKLIQALIALYGDNFHRVLSAFSEQEGIYGFGDLQVKERFDNLVKSVK